MDRALTFNAIREVLSSMENGCLSIYTDNEYKQMYDLLDELEKSTPKRGSDDWRGCQGTCDFDPIPNTTGWI